MVMKPCCPIQKKVDSDAGMGNELAVMLMHTMGQATLVKSQCNAMQLQCNMYHYAIRYIVQFVCCASLGQFHLLFGQNSNDQVLGNWTLDDLHLSDLESMQFPINTRSQRDMHSNIVYPFYCHHHLL